MTTKDTYTNSLPIAEYIPAGYRVWRDKMSDEDGEYIPFVKEKPSFWVEADPASAVRVRMDRNEADNMRKAAQWYILTLADALVEPFLEREVEKDLCNHLASQVVGMYRKYSVARDIFTAKKRRLFVDMDGTLCKWKPAEKFEDLYEQGWFANMEPNEALVITVKALYWSGLADIYILSAVLSDSPYSIPEKNAWLNEHLSELDMSRRVFVSTQEPKYKAVPGGVRADDILLDDYSKNLHEWAEKAVAVKLMNGVNGTGGTWESRGGETVKCGNSASSIVSRLLDILKS